MTPDRLTSTLPDDASPVELSPQLQAALGYLGRGWEVLDLPTRSKDPGRRGWQRERWSPDQLTERLSRGERNLGILLGEPSGWLVDVDLDCPEALRLAPVFLPKTSAVFGRKGAPGSHHLYVAEGATTGQFTDSDGAMLLELRSTGRQTIVPPSGEAITWDQDGDPAQVDPGVLVRQVRALAAASLVARRWHEGARHGAAGALAGGLLRAGHDVEAVVAFVGAVADAAGDDEVGDRQRHARDTAAKLAAGKPATGWPRLAELVGDDVVDRLRDWLDVQGRDAGWEPPLALGHQADLPPFPVDVLPGWLGEYVAALATATQTPPDLAGMLALAVLSAAAGRAVEVRVRPDWWEPVNLFVVVAQEPGTRKSAVVREVVEPLEALERELVEAATPEVAAARHQREVAVAHAADLKRRAAQGKLAREVAIEAAVEAELLTVPVLPRLLADDVTVEALASLLAEQGGRLAVLSPEGGIFDLLAGRYSPSGTPSLDVFLKGHAADPLRVDRKGRDPEYVQRPALTVGLAVQPEVLRGLADRPGFRGRGLLARFLYALPASTVGRRQVRPDPVGPEVRDRYQRRLRALAGRLADRPMTLTLEADALATLEAFMGELEPALGPDGAYAHVADWAAKLAGATVRIAALLHLAQAEVEGGRATAIGVEAMGAALTLAHYLIPHAVGAFAEMGADPALADARHLLATVERRGWDRFSVRGLFTVLARGRFPKVGDLEAPLALLEAHGYLRRQEAPPRSGPGRRPSPTYLVNPSGVAL